MTVGCIPITNNQIEEVYLLAAYAKNLGQDFIPVHIFPAQYNHKKNTDYLVVPQKVIFKIWAIKLS